MSDSQRTQILQAIDLRIWNLFKRVGGTGKQIFRQHHRGPLRPIKDQVMRPSYTVTDGGCRRAAPGDNESAAEVLAVRLALHVCATWEKEAAADEWSNNVELLRTALRGRPMGFGALEIQILRDEPMDVVFFSGAVQGDWIIDLEVPFFVEAEELNDWTE